MMSIASTGQLRKHQNVSQYSNSAEKRFESSKQIVMMIRIEKKIATDMFARAIIKPIFHYYIEVFTRLKSLTEQSSRLRRVNESRLLMALKKLLLVRDKGQKYLLSKGFNKIRLKTSRLDVLGDCNAINETFLLKLLSIMYQKRRIRGSFMRDPLVYRLFLRVKLTQVLKHRALDDTPVSVSRNLFDSFRKLHFVSSLSAFKDVGDRVVELKDRKNEFAALAMTKILRTAVNARLNSCKALFRQTKNENPLKSPSYQIMNKFVAKLYEVIVLRFSRYLKLVPQATNGLFKNEEKLIEHILTGKAWKKLEEHANSVTRVQKLRLSAFVKITFCIHSSIRRTCSSAFREFSEYAETVFVNSTNQNSHRMYNQDDIQDLVVMRTNHYIIFSQFLHVFSKSIHFNLKTAGWNAIQEFLVTQDQSNIHKQIFSQKIKAFASVIRCSASRQKNNQLALALCFETLNRSKNHSIYGPAQKPNGLQVHSTIALSLNKFSWLLKRKIKAKIAEGFYRLSKAQKSLQSTYIQKVSEKNFTAQINKNMIFNMSVVNSKLEKQINKRLAAVRKQNAIIKFSKLLIKQSSDEFQTKQYAVSVWQRNISFPKSKVNQYKHFIDVLKQENSVLLDEINQIQEAQRELSEQYEQKNEVSNSKEFHIGDLVSPTAQKLNGLKLDFDKDLKDSIFNKPIFANSEENEEASDSKNINAHLEFLESQNVELLGLIQQNQDEFELESSQYQGELEELISKLNVSAARNKISKTDVNLPLNKNFD